MTAKETVIKPQTEKGWKTIMKKKISWLLICLVILMGAMCILSCVSAGMIFTGNNAKGGEAVTEAQKTADLITAFSHIANAIALICGIIYILKGSGKNVAGLYKGFVTLVTIGLALRLAARLVFPGFDVISALMIGALSALLILSFGKDLGRKNTWSMFYSLIILDVAVGILMFDSKDAFSSIHSGVTRLALDGTIGVAISLKYKDKAARGSK